MSEIKRKTSVRTVKNPTNNAESASEDNSSSQRLALACARAIIDKKAVDTLILDVGKKGSFTNFFVISSGSNERQVQAMADGVLKDTRALGEKPNIEGYDQGRWILIDLGDVVVHLFHESLREFYHLEDLWTGATRLPIPQEFYTGGSSSSTQSHLRQA